MYGHPTNQEATEYLCLSGPLGNDHKMVELWEVRDLGGEDCAVEFVDYFPTVTGALKWAHRLARGTYHVTAGDGYQFCSAVILG